MAESKNSATRTINASAEDIFNLLSDPHRHTETDNSSSVLSVEKGDRITAVGDTFVMNMAKKDGQYQTRNEVFAFEENKTIGWQNQEVVDDGTEVGAKWLYELEAEGADSTKVTLTYDRSEIGNKDVLPMTEAFNDDYLAKSLDTLATAVSGS